MLYEIIKKVRSLAPLTIDQVSWDGTQLHVSGPGWGLHVLATWRQTQNGVMVVGCEDVIDAPEKLCLYGHKIVDIGLYQGALDPHFVLDDGRVFEFFSGSVMEPWALRIGDLRDVYYADPSNPKFYENVRPRDQA